MSIALIPESAPFNAEQRAWLNGFLAGWMGLQSGAGTPEVGTLALPSAPPVSAPALPAEAAPAAVEEETPWHDPALPIAERMRLADGKPLPLRLMAAMAQLDCGACGYQCRTYAQAIADGTEKSLSLCAPGGAETSRMLKQVVKAGTNGAPASTNGHAGANGSATNGHAGANGSATNGHAGANGSATNGHAGVNGLVTNGHAKAGPAVWSRTNPFPARVIRTVNLNQPGSAKETRHVEIDLGDSGLTYEVGDALGVYPTNCHELVGDLMTELGTAGDEAVTIAAGTTTTLRDALTRHCCLSEVTDEFLGLLAEAATQESERDALQALGFDPEPIQGWDVLDVLRGFLSARPAPADFVRSLAALRPRLYSISSSLRCHPGQVHLTVGRVAYSFRDRFRKGVASTMFADRLSPGDEVGIFVQKAHGFTVPKDPSTGMIMIGPGTGIAPFRAFLQERAATNAPGPNWLFFGDQRSDCDFLYESELRGFLERGVLSRLDTAFSRDQEAKVYVQHRMAERGAELYEWLQRGASVFVCGDAQRMARDVDRALHEIVQAHGGMTPAEAKEFVQRLAASGRYCRDVY